eukprot:TRINITY_DN13121_c0_g1_i2.p1 TRINITY_DN13121_c0_g1~~TRINITY_DN13121_c0_g1_i2.p1  ORF type:complete len:228 (-),score=16.66 TRINITY_DN13121_c0_g1_i2:60-686(-)
MCIRDRPGTVCLMSTCKTEFLSKKDPFSFNIHGLWPCRISNPYTPQFCPAQPFKRELLTSKTQTDIERQWSGLYSSTWRFVKQEWRKHGSCWHRSKDSSSNVIEAYFSKAVQVAVAFNVTAMLEAKNIKPRNDPYNYSGIAEAIKQGLGGHTGFVLRCEPINGRIYLLELRLCFGLDYTPIDCPADIMLEAVGCAGSKPIYFLSLIHI